MEYQPNEEDLRWTLNVIQGKTTWAMPSVGCVFKLDHLNKHFLILMKENPTPAETESVERIVTNLTVLGFQETGSFIMKGMTHVDQILAAMDSVDHL